MARFKLIIEYDGTEFVGWQHQKNGLSVQEVLEDAVFAFSGQRTRIQAAGRTDAGVHATHQVGHVDLSGEWRTDTVRDAMNAHLKRKAVSILEVSQVSDLFNARISARKRHYLYRIINRRAPLTLDVNRAWHVKWRMDTALMQAGADVLIGNHDFTTFRAAECQAASPVKTLDRLDIERVGLEIQIRASARSFLHHQVRSMVGSLILVATRKWTPGDLRLALDAKDRARCGPMAPPDGLYLIGVDYEGADHPVEV